MATLNFPDAPDTGDTYFDSNAGFNYEWNGSVWISKDLTRPNTTKEIDDISSGFDGADTTFTLQVDGVNIVPQDAKQLVITVGGAVQNPGDDYTVSGSTLTFTTAPSASVSFYGTCLGSAVSLNTISAASVSPSSFTTTSNYTVGSINVSGASTITNFILTGLTTITDPDLTYLNNTGVGTVSNVILTQDNAGLGATIGCAVGVVTYYGDGTNLTGTALTMMPLTYDPGISSTSQEASANIITTWNRPIEAGSGTITIREGSASGTVVDQFVVGSSSSITFSGNQLTLNPADTLGFSTTLYVTYPAGSIKAVGGQHENSQVITDFTTRAQNKTLWMWGYGGRGNLGQSNTTQYSSPVQIPGNNWSRITTLSSTYAAAFAFKSDGTAWSWGHNNKGQLAQGDTTALSSPKQVGTDTTWSRARGGNNLLIGTKTDGTIWTWGNNPEGGLGQNNQTPYSSPKQIGTGTDWVTNDMSKIGAGEGQMVAFKTDGSMWVWGQNSSGCLGQNAPQPSHRSSAVQLSGTTWKSASFIGNAVLAIKTDGTLWSWGNNAEGQLGQNQTAPLGYRSSPTQVGSATDWDKVMGSTMGGSSVGAIKTDGTLWMWGKNGYGGLGVNNRTTQSSPIQVPGTTWSDVESGSVGGAGSSNVLARKTDGTLWAWGVQDGDQDGALGQNNIVNYSSPVQISANSGNTWNVISAGSGYGAGIQAG